MESIYVMIGTAIISVVASIIAVRWMMEKEISFLNQFYQESHEEFLRELMEITTKFMQEVGNRYQ